MEMLLDFELTGVMPLLMCRDDVESADEIKLWQKDPRNKDVSVAGDDRSPAWSWHARVHNDGTKVALPFDMLHSNLRVGGSKKILKKQKTYKEATQTGICIRDQFLDFFTKLNGEWKQISIADIVALRNLPFHDQAEAVKELGFTLFVKRARPESARGSKHVRVRPRFESWKVRGSMLVSGAELTFPTLEEIFGLAGKMGLGDWRPGAPKSPGPFGQYTTVLKISGDKRVSA